MLTTNRVGQFTILGRLESDRTAIRDDGIRRGKVWLGKLLDWGYTAVELDGLIRELDWHIRQRDSQCKGKE